MARQVFIPRHTPGLIEQACNLLEEMLGLVAARTANWEVTANWCIACSRLGAVLHAEPDRCSCVCHTARNFIEKHRHKPEEMAG